MGRFYLNNEWIFYPFWTDACIRTSVAAQGEKVRLPHAAAFSYNEALTFHENQTEKRGGQDSNVWGYVRMLSVPEDFKGKALWLTFEGLAWRGDVYVNGHWVMNHEGGYTPFSADISPYLFYGRENRIAVRVDGSRLTCTQVIQGVSSDVFAGGIWGDVYVQVKERACIEDVFIRTKNAGIPELCGPAQMAVSVRFSREVLESPVKGAFVELAVFDRDDNCIYVQQYSIDDFFENHLSGEDFRDLDRGKYRTMNLRVRFPKVDYWDIDQPCLYFAELTLWSGQGRLLDSLRETVGFRDISFKKDGLYLNGRKRCISGLERRQNFPYVGLAVPESLQKMEADRLKDELCLQAVRTAFGPPSMHFIRQCDKKGILVFMGIPIDGHNEAGSFRPLREMIAAFRNHPSVIQWEIYSEGEGRNEQKALGIARRMDPSRSVRVLTRREDCSVFPAKIGDNDVCRLEQALECGRALEKVYAGQTQKADFIWSASDYPARAGLGNEDGVCYEGIMDMFRNPKDAAWLYASQGEETVCHVIMPQPWGHKNLCRYVWIFTNCDQVRVFREGEYVGTFEPDREMFGGLIHPPVRIHEKRLYGEDDAWRRMGASFTFEFIRDGQIISRIPKGPSKTAFLKLKSSRTCLVEKSSYDMALIHIEAVDKNGQILTGFNGPVGLMARGPAALVGPDMISLKGGVGGTLIRTLGGSGRVKITAFSPQARDGWIEFNVKKYRRL